MIQAGIQWGWRIPCAQAGCTKMHEVWASGGTPQVLQGPNDDGWFHWRRRSSDNGCHTWTAYCPEHAGKPKEWLAKSKAWNIARYTAWQNTRHASVSAWQKFKNMFVEDAPKDEYAVWLKANPQPYAPWAEPDWQ